MDSAAHILSQIAGLVWGPFMLLLIMGVGIYLTVHTRFLAWRKLPYALSLVFGKEAHKKEKGAGEVSSFGSLATALAATIGTGNIAGVATAMVLGGPGALVWMWISALFGLTTKFSECMLAVKYREITDTGEIRGGPMYVMKHAFRDKKIGMFAGGVFAFFTVGASFGMGNMTQANSISNALKASFGIDSKITGLIVMALTFLVILGGIRSIAKVAEIVVPAMAGFYILGALIVILFHFRDIPAGLYEIFSQAAAIRPVAGGVAGFTITGALQWGVARGVFSNEAGLGSAPIASAAAKTNEPARQGLVTMCGTFIDTIVVCTMTGISIVMMGSYEAINPATGKPFEGVEVTTHAFQQGYSFLPSQIPSFVLMICLVFFAFTTILGWNYYGERCLEYLANGNQRAVMVYRYLYILAVFIGPYMTVSAVWTIADIFNGLMALPNLIAILALSGVIAKESKEYFRSLKLQKNLQK